MVLRFMGWSRVKHPGSFAALMLLLVSLVSVLAGTQQSQAQTFSCPDFTISSGAKYISFTPQSCNASGAPNLSFRLTTFSTALGMTQRHLNSIRTASLSGPCTTNSLGVRYDGTPGSGVFCSGAFFFNADNVRYSMSLDFTALVGGGYDVRNIELHSLFSTVTAPVSYAPATPFTVSFDFEHAVTGFSSTDVSVTNGTISGLSGSGSSYSATITPNSTNNTIAVQIQANSVTDPFGGQNAKSAIKYVQAPMPGEIEVRGNGTVIVDGDTSPNSSDHTDFGNVDIGSGLVTRIYTIRNIGSGNLFLGPNAVTTVKNYAGIPVHRITQQPAETVPSGGSTQFAIRYDPFTAGAHNFSVSIKNDDPDETPYNFALRGTGVKTPRMDVLGNGVSISNNDLSPQVADGTDFERVQFGGGSKNHTFTVTNTGTGSLDLRYSSQNPVISGPNASEFSVTGLSGTGRILSPNETTTITASFTPASAGLKRATITFNSDFPTNGETPYAFAIRGIGANLSEIDVTGAGQGIPDGSASVSVGNHTDFGSIAAASGIVTRTFTIENIGAATLRLGANAASLSGANSSDYSIITQPSSIIAAGASSTVVVQFDPSTVGTKAATLNINSDDADESPYDFAIAGTATNTVATANAGPDASVASAA
ncbi:choice-of-anchor D domain-containing protein, partial [Ahrensia sp. R2A130]|uniref:choice-of-anchor D domain-containing protein n=1 Tax=Ahrensia sp. R2A130 TaxID=744979 RepID=UPI0001E0D0D9